MQTNFHVPRSHSFWEKCDDILKKFKVAHSPLINNLEILQDSIAFFSDTLWPRNLKFFLYINPYGYSMQTKFHVPRLHSFREKIRWYLEISIALFSDTVQPRNLKFFLYINPYWYSMQTKFNVPRSHSFREKCDDILQKFKVCIFAIINNFEIWQVSIACLSDSLWPRNLKLFLYINPYGNYLQTKFHVPRVTQFSRKMRWYLEISIAHFSRYCPTEELQNIFYTLSHMDTLCKPNFMLHGHTVFENNAMITWN